MMTPRPRQLLGLALLLVVPACTPRLLSDESHSRPSPTVITQAQIESGPHLDAYSLVQATRPHWLRTRGNSSLVQAEYVQVYQDGTRLGGPGVLRQISTHSILSIQYFDGRTATQRFGTQHGNGAIVVLTRRG